MTEAVQNEKRYLKTNYQIDGNYSHRTHSLLFTLSDVKKECLRVDNDTSNN